MSTESSTRESAFLTDSLGTLLWKNAGPAVMSMIVIALYQIVDGAMLGRRLGPDALAAVNILYPVVALLSALMAMLASGASARLGVLLGAGKSSDAGRLLSLMLLLSVALGVIGSIAALIFTTPMTGLLGASESIRGLAVGYLTTLAPFFVFFIVAFVFDQATRGDGSPGFASAVTGGAAVLNISLDYLFLFHLDLGMEGAALASGLAQTTAAVLFVARFVLKSAERTGSLRFRAPIFDRATIVAIAGNGSSEFFSTFSLGFVIFLYNRALMSYVGPLGVAAFAIVQYMLMIGTVMFTGVAVGAQPIISWNHGAGNHERVKGTVVRVIATTSVLGIVIALAAALRADTLSALFMPDHPEAILLTALALRIVAWAIIAAPLGVVGSVFFTAIERPKPSVVIAMLRGLIVPVIALGLFPLLWQDTGIWFVPVASEAVAALVAAFLLVRSLRTSRDRVRVEDAEATPETAKNIIAEVA